MQTDGYNNLRTHIFFAVISLGAFITFSSPFGKQLKNMLTAYFQNKAHRRRRRRRRRKTHTTTTTREFFLNRHPFFDYYYYFIQSPPSSSSSTALPFMR